jgi:hypothetical protein
MGREQDSSRRPRAHFYSRCRASDSERRSVATQVPRPLQRCATLFTRADGYTVPADDHSAVRRVSENIQVVTDDDLPPIQLANLVQQRLLRIGPAYPAGVRTVIQDQQTGFRFFRDLCQLTR